MNLLQKFRIKYKIRIVLLFLCFFIFSAFKSNSDTEEEYKLKAVFIYNFTLYIEWDPSTITNEFVIGIIGPSPIDEPLEQISHTKLCNGKKITIRHFNSLADIAFCNILFIPQSNSTPLNEILSKVQKGTLTVSEKKGYAKEGTAINFVIVDNKLKFESNVSAINSAGLKASSQLLKLAVIVE